MPQIIEEKSILAHVARIIIPSSGQMIIICKNYYFREAVRGALVDNSKSRSYSGDHDEQDYVVSDAPDIDDKAEFGKKLNVVVTGETKKALNALTNLKFISLATYRETAEAIKISLNETKVDNQPPPLTPTP